MLRSSQVMLRTASVQLRDVWLGLTATTLRLGQSFAPPVCHVLFMAQMEVKPKSEHLLALKGNYTSFSVAFHLCMLNGGSAVNIVIYAVLHCFSVMRLTRPTLASPVVVTCDSTDLPGNTLNNELKSDCTALQGMETLAVGQFMVLPQSFGYVFSY